MGRLERIAVPLRMDRRIKGANASEKKRTSFSSSASLTSVGMADARFTYAAALLFLCCSAPHKVFARKNVADSPPPSRKPKRR